MGTLGWKGSGSIIGMSVSVKVTMQEGRFGNTGIWTAYSSPL